jgi:hypothetical protein
MNFWQHSLMLAVGRRRDPMRNLEGQGPINANSGTVRTGRGSGISVEGFAVETRSGSAAGAQALVTSRAKAMFDKIERFNLCENTRAVAVALIDQADPDGFVETSIFMLAPALELPPREVSRAIFALECSGIIQEADVELPNARRVYDVFPITIGGAK